ncbi:HlyD family type I secretion periplasmic adaptor subunit [Pseudomonas veronii]|nr:HlyD family type I secretion periplasmic adaptor subunit [Pseudomonas veronii]
MVRAINVRDGQAVQAGEVLLTLDATTRDAEVQRLDGDRLAARLDLARASSMLLAIQGNCEPAPVEQWLADVGAGQQAAARHWVAGQYQEYRTVLDALEAEIRQRDAEIRAAKGQIDSLRQALPIATRLAEDYQHLLEKQYVTRHAYLEKEQARLELLRQLGVQQASLAQAQAGRQQSLRRRDGEAAKVQRDMLDLQQQAGQKIASLDQELTKARYEQSLTELRAPVAGTVQQLAVHTLGGVVTPAQPLLTLVPSDQQVEVEALLENKDVGFVNAGQPVSVKVETFNFSKYGTVAGEVVSVSQDAIEDEKRARQIQSVGRF